MEIIIILITGLSAAIFAWGCIMLGTKVRELKAELIDQEVQHHLEEQEYFKAIREAHAKIQSLERLYLERAQEMQRLRGIERDYIIKNQL